MNELTTAALMCSAARRSWSQRKRVAQAVAHENLDRGVRHTVPGCRPRRYTTRQLKDVHGRVASDQVLLRRLDARWPGAGHRLLQAGPCDRVLPRLLALVKRIEDEDSAIRLWFAVQTDAAPLAVALGHRTPELSR